MTEIPAGFADSDNSLKPLEKKLGFYQAELYTVSVERIPRFPETIAEADGEKSFEDSMFKVSIEKAREIADNNHYPIKSQILVGGIK
ncbi:hypothetical protein OYT88_19530 [Sporolactobacillus sp. CQH2019]|uniref:hypothetical protein n=1 Tax=Sporolactobacillus sp. CQH2019 TaxID=3023512 RepID=UPI002367F8CD|nr:hypothetical protein [Sporolactobacillus sp. CQH2019]MDD9150723.1 hypothetical protein [Sporolactobacillus sp. CQH2019]